jgi:hypothetical protein
LSGGETLVTANKRSCCAPPRPAEGSPRRCSLGTGGLCCGEARVCNRPRCSRGRGSPGRCRLEGGGLHCGTGGVRNRPSGFQGRGSRGYCRPGGGGRRCSLAAARPGLLTAPVASRGRPVRGAPDWKGRGCTAAQAVATALVA